MTAAAVATPRRSDLRVRTITGVALILVALGCIVYGQDPWWLLLASATLVMLAEWATMIRAERWQMWIAFAATAFALLLQQWRLDVTSLSATVALAMLAAIVAATTRNPRLAAGMLYAGLPTAALFYLHEQFDGIDLTFWTLAIVWATDIGAYFAGRRFGGPKLAPVMSPNKTWAGLIGGIVAAALAGMALAHILRLPMRLAGIAGLLAIAAQAGDLYESGMKRRAGVKDSGHVLPGHGGVMDRLDGVVPVACIVGLAVALGFV